MLPSWHCPFKTCSACEVPASLGKRKTQHQSPNHQQLFWEHIQKHHFHDLSRIINQYQLRDLYAKPRALFLPASCDDDLPYAMLLAAMRKQEVSGMPLVGLSSDRRTMSHLGEIFFDDNVHYNENDSIVAVRARANPSEPFRALSGKEALRFWRSSVVKVRIPSAIEDPDYFLGLVEEAEQLFETRRESLPCSPESLPRCP